MKKGTPMICNDNNSAFDLTKGTTATLQKTVFRNGEHHHKLKLADGSNIESPSCFWAEKGEA